MQKWLKSIVILCSLISCNTQGNKPSNKTHFNSMMLNSKTKTKEKLNLDANEALIFLINVLTDNTVANNIKIYTDERINEFIIHFNSQQINEMVTNIIKLLEIKKNIKDNIKILNDDYDNMATPIKMSLTKKLNDKLEEEINNYKIAIKIAADHDSFDIAKINIQNIPITNIIEIKDKVKQTVNVQNTIAAHLPSNHEQNAFHYLQYHLTKENTTDQHDNFNKLILYLNLDETRDMLTNITEELINKQDVLNYISQIHSDITKTELNNEIDDADTNLQNLLIKTVSNNTLSFDDIKQKIKNIVPSKFSKIKSKAKQAIENQNSIMINMHTGDIKANLDPKEREALKFITETLQDINRAEYNTTYTDNKINKFINYLGEQQIKEMVANTVKALEEIENSKNNIDILYYDKHYANESRDRLKEAINNYKIAIRRAADYDSFDVAKINIQNTPITKIIEIKDESKRAVDVQNIIKNLPGNYWGYYYVITYLKEIFPERNTHTHDTFNKFILNIHVDKAKYLITHLSKEFSKIENIKGIITHIKDTVKKSKLNDDLQEALKDLQKSIRIAFGNGTLPLDTIKQNFKNVHFHKFTEIHAQAKKL
ncbi:BTA121 domain-containing protein surface lipoprotein [Borrelia hispanica]|uniref:BTA121 domain-containing protein surface lipoprotein n=1 Tax=Borrelia hispanica TaxID=40835 RepID=UPI000465586C|nr:hypothetical protein [Borrelia hispanica]